MTPREKKLQRAQLHWRLAMLFPPGTTKHKDGMLLSWVYLLYWAGAPAIKEYH